MAVHSKLVIILSTVGIINAQFQARPDSSLPQNLLDAQQQFREAQEQLKVAQHESDDGPAKGRSLANLVASLQNQATTEQNTQLLTETLADPENYEYENYEYDLEDYDYETTTADLPEDAMRRRKKKKKKPKRPMKKPGGGPNGIMHYTQANFKEIDNMYNKLQSTTPANKHKKPATTQANKHKKPMGITSQYPPGMNPKNKAKKPKKPIKKPASLKEKQQYPKGVNTNSEFDEKGQWIGGGQLTDYDYYDKDNTFNAIDSDNKLQEWDQDPTGNNNNNWGENSYANADLNIDYGFQVNPDMPSYEKNNKKNDRNNIASSGTSANTNNNRATWDQWGECTPEKIAQNADLLANEFTVLKLHNYGCWCTIIGEKRECLKGKPQDPIDTFCRDWLACRRCTLFAPHYCGRENLHNNDENAYGLEFFQKIIAGTFTCDHLTGDDCEYNRCLCDKEMGEQIMCKMDTFTDIYVGVDVDDCPRHNDADYCAPDSCCGDFPHVTPWSTTCHQCNNGTRTRL